MTELAGRVGDARALPTATSARRMQAATRGGRATLLVDQWGFTTEEAFVFLSVACDVGICQACRPSPFSAIARVSIPKLGATPVAI